MPAAAASTPPASSRRRRCCTSIPGPDQTIRGVVSAPPLILWERLQSRAFALAPSPCAGRGLGGVPTVRVDPKDTPCLRRGGTKLAAEAAPTKAKACICDINLRSEEHTSELQSLMRI